MNKSSLVVCALVFVAACVSCQQNGMAAEYTATAYFKVELREPTIMARVERDFSEEEFAVFKKTQPYLLKSRFVLMTALRKPEVAKIPDVKTAMREGDPVRWLDKQIRVRFPGKGQLMAASCTRNNADEAQTLLRAVVDAYMMEVVNVERDSKRENVSELERVFASYGQELRVKKQVLRNMTKDLSNDAEKVKPKRPTVDMEMLQLDITTFEKLIGEIRMELERQKIELRARSRITQLGPIEKPLMPD